MSLRTLKNLLIVATLALTMASCSSSPTAPSAFTSTLTGTIAIFGTDLRTLSIPQSGTLTLTLTWADSTVDLDLYLAPSTCTNLFSATCGVLVSSVLPVGTTTETVSRAVTSGQTFSVFVDSLSLTKTQAWSVAVKIQ